MILQSLNPKHRMFVEAYDGDEIYAMKLAGFSGTDLYLKQQADILLKQPLIIKAIEARDLYTGKRNKAIADRHERQALWTSFMRNNDPHRIEERDSNGVPIPPTNIPIPVRLKATELLGKSEADFVEKVDMNVQHSLSDLILESYSPKQVENDLTIEQIEAEYLATKRRQQALPVIEIDEVEEVNSIEDFI